MTWNALANEKHCKVVREVVAVVQKQVIGLVDISSGNDERKRVMDLGDGAYFSGVNRFQRLEVFQDDFQGQRRLTKLDYLHWATMMGRTRITGMDSLTEEIFNTTKDDGRVIDGVDVDAEELTRHLPCEAFGQIVDIELDVHDGATCLRTVFINPCRQVSRSDV